MPRLTLEEPQNIRDVLRELKEVRAELAEVRETLVSLLAAMGSVNCSQVQLAREVRTARIEMDGTRQDLPTSPMRNMTPSCRAS